MQSRDAACPRSESNPSFLPLSWEAVCLPHQQLLLQPWGQPGATKGGERQGRAQGCLILCRQTSVLLHTHIPGTSPKIVHSFPSVSPSRLFRLTTGRGSLAFCGNWVHPTRSASLNSTSTSYTCSLGPRGNPKHTPNETRVRVAKSQADTHLRDCP